MKKRLLKLTLMFLLTSAGAFAQQVVSGKITSSLDGAPLPGVSILIKGTSSGTTTDSEGKFSLTTLDPSNVLVISFIGYASQEVAVTNRTTIDVIMNEDAAQLGEVVVTALGIEREKKALGYSVQEVKGQDFQQARESNIINNLQGRVAGVQIYKGGTGPGGSSRIVIRGASSLGGQNQPLFVIDGVPFDNFDTSTGTSEYGANDTGQGIGQVNPDDIETMTVLKGPEAGALYGNRGANGVILITTKKGKARKGFGVNYSNNTTFDSPLLLPDMQNVYGQGSNGAYDVGANKFTDASWGPKATGQSAEFWDGNHPMKIVKDDIKQFLNTGRAISNSFDVSTGDDKSTFRLGYTNYDLRGLVPTSSIKRNMLSLRATSNITDRLSVDVKVSFSRQDGHNRPATSGSPYNPFNFYTNKPRSIQMEDLMPWKDSNGLMIIYVPTAYSTQKNPYWVVNENYNNDRNERLLSMVKIDYKIASWLKVFLRHGLDMNYGHNDGANSYGGGNPADPLSYNFESGYYANRSSSSETNTDGLLTATKTISDFTGSLSVGANRRSNNYDNVGGSTNTLVFGNYYNLRAGTNPRPYSDIVKSQVNSVYSFANIAWKNAVFLDLSFRNDWSSTVSPKNRSFHYGSASGSVVISDLVTLPAAISYLKVRGGYAQTGKTIEPYKLQYTYTVAAGFNNAQSTSDSKQGLNPNILPEKVNSFEVGADIKVLQNRIGLEVAYYSKSTTDQIIPIPVPGQTGFTTKFINAGNITNQGVEFVLSGTPVKTTSFQWNVALNFNHNVNKVKELAPGFNRYFLADQVSSRALNVVADIGRPMGDLYGRDFARDENGRVLVDDTGAPTKSQDKATYLGNYQPRYTAGFVNSLSFKGLTLGFVIDARVGGVIYSQTNASMAANGNAAFTLPNREGGLIVNGVHEGGAENATAINAQTYWQSVAGFEGVASQFIYDATNVRLREATLSYALPTSMLAKTPFTRISVGFVSRNLFMIVNHLPGIDPESTFNVTNAQGIENSSYPSYRSYGVNVNLGF